MKAKKDHKTRELTTLGMLLHCKGGSMKHRNARRSKDARKSWKNEER